MFGLGGQEIIIILLIVGLLFGAKKLPEIGKSLGEGLREFKKTTRVLVEDDTEKHSS
ncbi:MAG: twin-arginine translocase TatA/TatE family subunit [Armatimonadota bacterium]